MDIFERAAQATVKVTKKVGQGVLVPGELVLTAAHCINWNSEGSMVLGDYFIEELESGLSTLKLGPLAVEPVSDIAVLGPLDDQEFPAECEWFETFCAGADPVPLCLDEFEPFKPFPVSIRAHTGEWIKGIAQQCGEHAQSLSIETTRPVLGGTSGGPIIDDQGQLVAIVSNHSETISNGKYSGSHPRPSQVLPRWLLRTIAPELA